MEWETAQLEVIGVFCQQGQSVFSAGKDAQWAWKHTIKR